CSILPPDLSVITNIGTAHVDNLGGRIEDVARTKSEIIKGMNPSGTLFLNADDENSKLLQTHDFKGKIVRVGTNNTADYIAYNIHYVENGMSFCVKISGEEQTFFIPIYGQHNVYNAMFAIAIAHMYGFSPDDMRKGLATYQRPNARLTIHQLDKGIQLIDDTCHANPEAMKVAIDVLAQIGKGQTIAVFERMSTRGNHAIEGYRQVGKHLAEQKIDYLFTLGKKAVYYGEGAIEAGYPTEKLFHFLDKDQMHQELLKHIEPGATVLIKGARERKMVETVEFLQKQYKK
ncbi:MAG TPA: UDP-N-acetylmuramoyl-tripeptide--D-alanyl-D-alanine ligase, partial [Bacillota bacterium]|nr:UDP-N-acetylmuramoyl-tripeptide--D-alanyl-D-alanine ligase [Bacillota bacterium]